ncbi:MAG: flotillin family protein [Thermoplasmata archaeon]|nr:MAG: flotillin family protein [Thermoplasmata archaeon]
MASDGSEVALIAIGNIVIAFMVTILIYAKRYKKVPPNKAMVVFGKKQMRTRKGYLIITGGAKFIIPFLEDFTFMPLDARSLRIALNNVRVDTRNIKASISLKANSVVRISSDPRILDLAAANLLGKSDKEINDIAMNIIEGHVRNTCAHTPLEEIRDNFPQVSSMILSTSNFDLNGVGLEMVSFNIVDVQ